MPMGWITVIDVFRDLGVEPIPADTWSAGARVRDAWMAKHGTLPVKDNRVKTSGHGSHCFALYPPDWREFIEKVVRTYATEKAKQLDLFRSPGELVPDAQVGADVTEAEH